MSEVNAYKRRTKNSRTSHKEAKKYIPLGVSSTLRYFDPHPLFIKQAKGSTVVDVDGNEYIDFSMNYGAQLVGHAHPKVVEAVKKQMDKGSLFTMPHKAMTEFAKEITNRFPVDQVRFTNSGTETTMHAVRLARGYTDKDKIIKIAGGYHGVHDYLLADEDKNGELSPTSNGIPSQTQESVLMATFNDLNSIRSLFDKHEGEIAAVIMEPLMFNLGTILPEDGFLEEVQEICHKEGALLIFDEVKTGAKLAWGGACQYFNMEPDIVCLAKSIGGGLPIGAFGAREEIMSEIKPEGGVVHAGTYNANPLAVQAGLTTLRDILTKDVYEKVFSLSQELAEGYTQIIEDFDLSAHVVSAGPCGTVYFCKGPIKNHKDFMRKFQSKKENIDAAEMYWFGMLNQGIIPHPRERPCTEQWTISIQHSQEDIDSHLQAFEKIVPELKRISEGNERG